ncbi:energy transducer TonB [Helicobacter didelphidarum]|uniref:Energy transducer TonB n=1 Tax=Helicobacter didelphidarum TaxID=2040648 RepID=A0A3D8ILH0_9HELI|nr:energy transducer TonB [Helicobacter didelphidarum]RDU65963.1 energy transducer TonB [Helicobacter didelphidarum]
MINLELIRNTIKNPSFYGVVFAFVGAAGIFGYSVYHDSNIMKEKENGDNFVTIQLTAYAPPSNDPIAEQIQKPKPKQHKKRKRHREIDAPPKPTPSDLQVKKEIQKEEIPQVTEMKKIEQEVVDAQTTTTIQSSPDALANENIKVMRYSEGIDSAFLRAIRVAIEKRHDYPNLAKQRGYEGEVLIKFLIQESGEVSNIEVIHGSKYSVLDKAAVKTLRRACKDFPKPPETTYIEIPIGYMLAKS